MEKKAITRSETLRFRVFSLEKKAIQLAARQAGMPISEYLRQCALGKEIKFRLTDEEIEIFQMLRQYRTNFSRLSSMIKKHEPGKVKVLDELIKGIDEQLNKLR